jgi:hypothetical protein
VGPGGIPLEKVSLSIESSGAWGPEFKKLWCELKAAQKELKLENYIRMGLPSTWTAFTYSQWWPQKVSFAIARMTAQMVIAGLRKARRFAVPC